MLYTHTQDSGNSVTVFVFNFENKSDDEVRLVIYYYNLIYIYILQIRLARSAHLRLKTLRHPNILKYIDGIEVIMISPCII